MRTLPIASRRTFLTTVATASAGMMMPEAARGAATDELNVLGPKPGYSPQVGTLVSMLTWMQPALTRPVKRITQANLDYLFDANANSIGALFAAFGADGEILPDEHVDGMKWDSWPDAVKQKWDPAMSLGDIGRKTIKGTIWIFI
jgi:hypothetical protein